LAGSFCTPSNGLSVPAQPALALLREVPAIDVAFFDEPTANRDGRRRDNLAEQILNVKGFSQLFVISHDDAFERDTDHVVRVVKDDGVSRVVEAQRVRLAVAPCVMVMSGFSLRGGLAVVFRLAI
jgi:ABC-type transport system involved in cytochrome bd biosynthesis fused ATPase/permease subunit